MDATLVQIVAKGDPLLVIAGPTASGKSDFSMRCAGALNGEVLSVDSVQVYRGLDIGSAKVSAAQRAAIPHHMLDIRDPEEKFNVADFLREAETVLADLSRRQKRCVVCAGTTLYLTALLHGLVEAPPQDEGFRQTLAGRSDEELHDMLAGVDAKSAARLHKNDRIRVVRALETVRSSGSTQTELHCAHGYRSIRHPALIVVLCRDRKALYARIDARSRMMVEAGLVGEVRSILAQAPQAEHALRTLGYAQARAFVAGELAEDGLVPEIAMQTRRYAKRQMTYWRNEPQKRGWTTRPRPDEQAHELQTSGAATRGRTEKSFRVLSLPAEEMLQAIRGRLETLSEGIELWYVDAAALDSRGS